MVSSRLTAPPQTSVHDWPGRESCQHTLFTRTPPPDGQRVTRPAVRKEASRGSIVSVRIPAQRRGQNSGGVWGWPVGRAGPRPAEDALRSLVSTVAHCATA